MSRLAEIRHLLAQLDAPRAGDAYALRETRELLLAMQSPDRYALWMAAHMPGLQRDGLLEINELLPQWDEPVHRKLLEIERERWPGFVGPLVSAVSQDVLERRPGVVLDIGAGAMEIERQVIAQLLERRAGGVTFVGVDESAEALKLARENLQSLPASVKVLEMPLAEALRPIAAADEIRVVFCRASAADLHTLSAPRVGLIMHSFVRHHLTQAHRIELDALCVAMADATLEYDGYRNWAALLAVSMVAWGSPAFLAAYVFSHVRFEKRDELAARAGLSEIRFLRNGCYLARRG